MLELGIGERLPPKGRVEDSRYAVVCMRVPAPRRRHRESEDLDALGAGEFAGPPLGLWHYHAGPHYA